MKKFLLILAYWGATHVFTAAQSIIEFEKETHDFGTIQEGQIVSYDFVFKNKGKSPLILQSVEPSCGCTTPNYTREPIPPGGTGKITVAFNSQGRPNAFHKSVTVRTNSVEPIKVIYIKGFVNPKAPTPASQAELFIEKSEYNLGNLQLGQTAIQRVTIKNVGKEDLRISTIRSDCNCVTYNHLGNVAPNESAVLELRYTPRQKGNLVENVMIYSNDGKVPMHLIKLKANVTEGSPLKENAQKNPFGF